MILLAAGGVAIALATRGASGNFGGHKVSALQRQELTNTANAVAWIENQVSPDSVVACDPATCTALKAHDYAAGKLHVLGPTSLPPRTATLLVETASVRRLFGTSLRSDWAPIVLTAFGSGAAEVDIRVIANDGASAYQRALTADLSARKLAWSALLHGSGSQITASTTAKKQMLSGAVDPRLLNAIGEIVGAQPVDIIDFGNVAPGGSSGVPLRYGDLSERVPSVRMAPSAYVAAIRSVLGGMPARYQPLSTQTVPLPGGVVVLRIEYPAPSPLGLLGPTG